MDKKEKPIRQEYVYKGKIINVRNDVAELPDGNVVPREVVEHCGGVGIALEDDDGKFFFVKQFRYAQAVETMEYPAGKKEPGEDPFDTARREIVEETGYEGKDWVFLGVMYPTPAYDEEVLHMFYAKKGDYKGQHLDPDENLNVYRYSLEEMTDQILAGGIPDAKTIAMTFIVKEMKARGKL